MVTNIIIYHMSCTLLSVDFLFVSAIVPFNNKAIPEPLGCGSVGDRNVVTNIIIKHRSCTLL